MNCQCSLCKARELSAKLGRTVHPWEVMYGFDSFAAGYVRKYPDKPIWFYDEMKRASEVLGREVTPDEASQVTLQQHKEWSERQK